MTTIVDITRQKFNIDLTTLEYLMLSHGSVEISFIY